jgi:RNA polymerase sigma-70 factor (ECF subfamily)
MDERELLKRCIARDERAWDDFLKSYGGCIYATIANLLRRFSIQEQEVAQDIFASVIEKLLADDCAALRRFQWSARLTTWLISIARNKTYDHLRSLKRRPTISLSTPLDGGEDELEKIIGSEIDLDHDLEVRLTAEEILAELPPKDRLVLRLYYLEGMKDREIGEILDLSADAVSARKSRALKKLRNLVGKDRRRTSYS